MADPFQPEISATVQPRQEDVAFDLDKVLSSVVSLTSQVPLDAHSAATLGPERQGNGVLIRDDLVLTVGYLITEAETIWLIGNNGKATLAHAVGSDQATGFALVQALQPLDLPPIELGNSAALSVGERVIVAGHGGRNQAIKARVITKQEFAGYWEYVLDEAIFTAPAHPNWGGTAIIAGDGTLRGIGSLFVQEGPPGNAPVDGNMVIPIDLLKPILDDIMQYGSTKQPPRPWLGMSTMEADENLVVASLSKGGPAQMADIRIGDFVIEIAGEQVDSLAGMFRRIWSLGSAGVEVPLTIYRDGALIGVNVQSCNRADRLKSPRLH